MKTIILILAIVVCLPASAQRVKENIHQRVSSSEDVVQEVEENQEVKEQNAASKPTKKQSVDRPVDQTRKK